MSWTTQVTVSIQTRLAVLGYYRLNIDGKFGPGTSNAMIRFKENNGLRARDYPGPITMERLYSPDAIPALGLTPESGTGEPVWLAEARELLGTRERRGAGNNPTIMRWATDLDQWYPGDDVPWCGLFVAHCFAVGAPEEQQNYFNRLGAREWVKFGKAVPHEGSGPLALGGCAVLWRGSINSWKGHVCFITRWNETHFAAIGGNQSDNVTEAWFPRSRLVGVRVPKDHDPIDAPHARTGELSTTEA